MGRARDIANLIGGATPDIILKTSDGAILNLQTSDTTVTQDSVLGAINFQAPDEADGTDAILVASKIEAIAEGTFSASSNATSLVFTTASSAAAGTASGKMTFTSGGELVIKDTDTADGSSPTITLQSGDDDIAQDDVLGTINFQAPDHGDGSDGTLVAAGIIAISEGDFSASVNTTSLVFQTGASEGAAEKVRITSAGKMGIATNDPQDIFHAYEASGQRVARFEANNSTSAHIAFKASNTSLMPTVGVKDEDLYFSTGDAVERARFDADSNGDLILQTGNLVIGTAGKGIDFSNATDEGTGETTTSSILDDYEEGSFSVAEQNSSLGMTLNFAEYTKIGRAIHFILHVTFGSGTDSSPIQLTGMPFDGNNSKIQTVSVFTSYTGGQIIPIVQSSTIFMQKNNATVDLTYSDVSGKFVRLSGTYQIL